MPKPRCVVTNRVSGTCDACRRCPEELHLPQRAHGFFCRACCPECSQPTTLARQRRTARKLEQPTEGAMK